MLAWADIRRPLIRARSAEHISSLYSVDFLLFVYNKSARNKFKGGWSMAVKEMKIMVKIDKLY